MKHGSSKCLLTLHPPHSRGWFSPPRKLLTRLLVDDIINTTLGVTTLSLLIQMELVLSTPSDTEAITLTPKQDFITSTAAIMIPLLADSSMQTP